MNDHVVLTINGLVVYESNIGTRPVEPTPVPVPPSPPPPPSRSVPYHLYQGETREGLEYKFRAGYAKMPEGWSWEDFAASGFMEGAITYDAAPAEQTNDITPSNTPHRRELHKGDEHAFNVPTYPGERVTLTLIEVQGTPDSLHHTSYVTDERHRVLSNPKYHLRHGDHTFTAQEGTKTYLYITPTDSGPIGIQRS